MKKISRCVFLATAALFLAACGDSSTSSEDSSAYESVLDLPNCTALEAGMEAYVKAEKATYVCLGGKWVVDSSSSEKTNSSDSAEPESSESGSEPESSDGWTSTQSSTSRTQDPDGGSIYDSTTNTLTDLRDGQVYRTTTISIPTKDYSEVWMAENLNYATDNSYCYGDNPENCAKYGRLYTWTAAVGKSETECGRGHSCDLGGGDIQGVCPQGWHLPSKAELKALIVAVDGSITEYTTPNTAGIKLKSASGWNNSGNGADTYSFSAHPVGNRANDGYYYNEGSRAYFWSSTELDSDYTYSMGLDYDYDYAYLNTNKYAMYSVRCLKDEFF